MASEPEKKKNHYFSDGLGALLMSGRLELKVPTLNQAKQLRMGICTHIPTF